jgi:hypothetical protein
METHEPAAQALEQNEQLHHDLMDKLSTFLDKILEQSALLVNTAIELFRNHFPQAIPWPVLPAASQLLQFIQFRLLQPDPKIPNPLIPNPFPFIHKDKLLSQRLPSHLQLRLKPVPIKS